MSTTSTVQEDGDEPFGAEARGEMLMGSPDLFEWLEATENAGDAPRPSFVKAVVLSAWDNVMGPAVRKVWPPQEDLEDDFRTRVLPFIPKYSLNGEIMRNIPEDVIENKFQVLNQLGIAMVSLIFTCRVGPEAKEGDETYHSLVLVVPRDKLSAYLRIHPLCADRLPSLIKKLRVLLHKKPKLEVALDCFTQELTPFIEELDSIGVESLKDGINLSNTAFGRGHETCFDLDFLRIAITAHLQTGGVTIVVGKDESIVNRMIDTLALFLTQNERRRSRYAHSGSNAKYAPDLFLQGIIQNDAGKGLGVDPEEVIQSMQPSTIINMTAMKVLQTKKINEYTVIHKESEAEELQRLEGVKEEKAHAHQGLIHNVSDVASIVKTLLDEVFKPHVPTIRYVLIKQFHRLLSRKALVVIQHVNAYDAGHNTCLHRREVTKLKTILKVDKHSDFLIYVAFAEKLKRGVCMTLLGDPKARQEKLVKILTSF